MECADGGVARVLGGGLTADGQLVVLVLNSSSFNNGVAYTMKIFSRYPIDLKLFWSKICSLGF